MTLGAVLLELQKLDDRLAVLRDQVATLEATLARDPELDRARRRAAAAAERRRAADAAVADADRQVTALRQRARQLDRQLYGGSVRNPHDLLTLQRELDEVRARLAAAEEVELGKMEEAEAAIVAEREATAAVVALETARADRVDADRARLYRAQEELEMTGQRRSEVANSLPGAVLRLYERLATRRQPAVVRLLGEACGGCRIALGGHEVHAVRAGEEVVQCPNCDRIVVR